MLALLGEDRIEPRQLVRWVRLVFLLSGGGEKGSKKYGDTNLFANVTEEITRLNLVQERKYRVGKQNQTKTQSNEGTLMKKWPSNLARK